MISPKIALIALSIATANALIQSAENSTSLNCATGAHIQALGFTFEYMNANNTDTGINLPEMPIEYADNPSLCVPTSLFDSYFEAIEAQAKLLDIQSDNGLSLISRAPKAPATAGSSKKPKYLRFTSTPALPPLTRTSVDRAPTGPLALLRPRSLLVDSRSSRPRQSLAVLLLPWLLELIILKSVWRSS